MHLEMHTHMLRGKKPNKNAIQKWGSNNSRAFLRQTKREWAGESDSEREPEAAKFSSMNYTLLPCARALSGFVFVLLLLLGA